jgi:hypothetical protein
MPTTTKAKRRTPAKAKRIAKPKHTRSTYDWQAAEAKAAKGVLPQPPDFSAPTHKSWHKRFAALVAMARRGDLAALQADSTRPEICGSTTKIVCRYRSLAITALEAKRAAQAAA